MSFWSNLIGYQLVWFAAVIGAGRGTPWPGTIAAALFVAWQLSMPGRAREWRLVVAAVVAGVLVDGGLAGSGLAVYAAARPALPAGGAPLWILALWSAFALTLTQSLSALRTRAWLAPLLGAIGAPLAYLGAARGWQAMTFAPPVWPGVLALAIGWAVALTLLARWAQRIERSDGAVTTPLLRRDR
ncbi:DUF2878 domain-containing protein [Lysobacter sp. Root983]|uniref:DUF2878 domain-containing protein n=1 Tax=Lysobacter sp. Root983 TaxID=1736613 RepID=UPI000710803F|nr:DUF2878 domain-containing protein [Lysobacter sp. Root983]KRD80349.1 hypothetical protein ASE43_05660 [Lysobacter sp. Root983]